MGTPPAKLGVACQLQKRKREKKKGKKKTHSKKRGSSNDNKAHAMRCGLISKNPGIANGHKGDVKKIWVEDLVTSIDRRCFRAGLDKSDQYARVCVYSHLR